MILDETYILSNGVEIPKPALGTWFIDDNQVGDAIGAATEIGYRHIDTAQVCGNENGVGAGIRSCGIPRQSLRDHLAGGRAQGLRGGKSGH